MKEFAGDKQGAGKKDTGEAAGRAKDDSRGGQGQGFGGYGAGEGQVAPPNPMAAMRFGHMGAIRMAQSGGVDVTKHIGKSAKGGGAEGASGEKEVLGSLGEVNSGISQKLAKSTGVDVSDAKVVSDPKLEDMGKRGVARDGKEIGVAAPELVGDDQLMAHEGIHIVQQRGGRHEKAGAKGSPEAGSRHGDESLLGGADQVKCTECEPTRTLGAEEEAVKAESVVLAGQPASLSNSNSPELFQEVEEEFVFDEEPVFLSSPDKGQRGGWHVVQAHESLSKVAAEWYGEQGKYSLIYNANREVIGDNPAAIGKGMRLFIPPLDIKTALQTNIPESMTMANEGARDTAYPVTPVDSPNPGHELLEINGEFPNGYMDPNYWEYAGQRWSFRLVDGASASAAVDSLFQGPTRLECESMLVAVLARSVKETVGPSVFDREFGAVGKSNQDLVIGASSSQDLVKSRLYEMLEWPHPEHGNDLLPGDMVWIVTFDPNGPDKDRYKRKHPGGFWQGLNATYMGHDEFQGFGVKSRSLVDIKRLLFDAYNANPSDPHAGNDQLEEVDDVFGLVLEATVRLDDKPLSEMLK